jgi:hypothetical protein
MRAAAWPNRFVVDTAKVTQYLLNLDHPHGWSKARFFLSVGFGPADPAIMADALLAQARPETFTDAAHSPHGVRFGFEGPLRTPSGAAVHVRTAWQVDANDASGTARFLTAFPLPKPRLDPLARSG